METKANSVIKEREVRPRYLFFWFIFFVKLNIFLLGVIGPSGDPGYGGDSLIGPPGPPGPAIAGLLLNNYFFLYFCCFII